MHPLAGQGLNLGLADAAALAEVIKTRDYWRSVGDARLLRRYERARRTDVLSMSLATDGLQQLFAHSADPPAGAAQLGHARLRPHTGSSRTGSPARPWAGNERDTARKPVTMKPPDPPLLLRRPRGPWPFGRR